VANSLRNAISRPSTMRMLQNFHIGELTVQGNFIGYVPNKLVTWAE
jgi:hypothetical protein